MKISEEDIAIRIIICIGDLKTTVRVRDVNSAASAHLVDEEHFRFLRYVERDGFFHVAVCTGVQHHVAVLVLVIEEELEGEADSWR